MKMFAVALLAVCAVSAYAAESVVKVDRAGGTFAYSVEQGLPHPYVAHSPYVSPVHPGVDPVLGKQVVTYTAGHPLGAVPVPVGGYYGYPYPSPYGYPYAVPVKPEKIE